MVEQKRYRFSRHSRKVTRYMPWKRNLLLSKTQQKTLEKNGFVTIYGQEFRYEDFYECVVLNSYKKEIMREFLRG